jgi:tetratricopeptide (TPR) repeat protein
MRNQLNKWRNGAAVLALMACTAMPWGQVLASENPPPKQLVQALEQLPALEEAFAKGKAHWSNKQWAASASAWQKLLAQTQSQYGEGHITTETAAFYLGDTYLEQGHYKQALPLLQRAAQAHVQQLGDHVTSAQSIEKLARVHSKMALHKQALGLQKKALQIRETVSEPDHPDTALAISDLALIHTALAQHDIAGPLHARALSIIESALGEDDTKKGLVLRAKAETHSALGQHNQALSLQLRALAIFERTVGPFHIDTASSLNNW